MQLVENFKLIDINNFWPLLKDGEVAIKNISQSDNRVYARKYIYNQDGTSEINDRLLPLEYNINNIDSQKMVIINYKEVGEFIPKSKNPLHGKEIRVNLNYKK